MLNDSPDQCPPTRKRTVSVGKFEQKDSSTDLAPPSAKVLHVAAEPAKTASLTIGTSSATQPWPHTAQPISTYGSGTVRMTEFNQLKWHQPPTETDPFFVASLDPAFASPTYTPTSCTPLAPISELLSPQQFTSYDLRAVEIPSPPSYVTIQTVSGEPSSFTGHSLTALSSVPMLDTSSQPSLETYTEAGSALAEGPIVVDSTLASAEGLQVQGPQWSPGWSMLRQMLSQSHRENALMHGVVSEGRLNPPTSAEYPHSGEDQSLQPPTTAALHFVSSTITDHGFQYVSSQPSITTSDDVVYVQMTAETDDTSALPQVTADVGGTLPQLVITDYSEVPATVDVPKTADADNNNEGVSEEKSV